MKLFRKREDPGLFNFDIPGKTGLSDLQYLARLAQSVPENGVIVEVGPLYGRSTWTLARAAHPSVTVYAIDLWETAPWIEKMRKEERCKPFSVESFKYYTRDCPNIIAMKGPSPDVADGWELPVDAYFEDANHGNPELGRNLDFWTPFIKPGGILCGHDYSIRFPDVGREVMKIEEAWGGCKAEIIDTLWALRRPGKGMPDTVFDGLEIPDIPLLRMTTINKHMGEKHWPPLVYCGQIINPDRLEEVTLNWHKPVAGLDVEYRVLHPERGASRWVRSGSAAYVPDPDDKPRPFQHFAARLVGERAGEFDIEYNAFHRQIGNGGFEKSGKTATEENGEWTVHDVPGASITALRVEVKKKARG